MKTKPLEVGDNVNVKEIVSFRGKDATVYIDGRIKEIDTDNQKALVGYQLTAIAIDVEPYKDWWDFEDITSKHIIGKSDSEKFEDAEKIKSSDWKDPVFYNDKYYDSVEELLDDVESSGDDAPAWVFGTTQYKPRLRVGVVDRVMDHLEEECYEGINEEQRTIKAIDILQDAEDKYVELMGEVNCYEVDYAKVILLKD